MRRCLLRLLLFVRYSANSFSCCTNESLITVSFLLGHVLLVVFCIAQAFLYIGTMHVMGAFGVLGCIGHGGTHTDMATCIGYNGMHVRAYEHGNDGFWHLSV